MLKKVNLAKSAKDWKFQERIFISKKKAMFFFQFVYPFHKLPILF